MTEQEYVADVEIRVFAKNPRDAEKKIIAVIGGRFADSGVVRVEKADNAAENLARGDGTKAVS